MNKKVVVFVVLFAIIIASPFIAVLLTPPVRYIDEWNPTIEIINPTFTVYENTPILVEISAWDNKEIDTIWYNWAGENITYTSELYISPTPGLNTLFAWANDTSGNMASDSIMFTIISEVSFCGVWNTSKIEYSWDPDDNRKVNLPLRSDGFYQFIVDWNDTTITTITNLNNYQANHLYATPGVYNITITGTFIGFGFQNSYANKLVEIKRWGNIRLGNAGGYFAGCINLNKTASDTLDLTGTTNFENMFSLCSNLAEVPGIEDWDVSKVTNMRNLFGGYYYGGSDSFEYSSKFNQNISKWDVSHVTDMSSMFAGATQFNQSIGGWNVSSVTNMNSMFWCAYNFNQDINSWDVSHVTDMEYMFRRAISFNKSLNAWDTSSVTNMNSMFLRAEIFNQSIDNWDVSKVTNMHAMFSQAYDFNQDLDSWDVSHVTTMEDMFSYAESFNAKIGSWDVSSVTTMREMFYECRLFNQDIGSWDVSSVISMVSMFWECNEFNQDIGLWDVSHVELMSYMFYEAHDFNQDISTWNVSHVTNMAYMFYIYEWWWYGINYFNQNISAWDVSHVTSMSGMFFGQRYFNQNISNWDVSRVTDMSGMFYKAETFNQNLGTWNVSKVTNMADMFVAASLSTPNYNSLLNGWSQLPLQHGVNFHAGGSKYSISEAGAAWTKLTNEFEWTITDGGPVA